MMTKQTAQTIIDEYLREPMAYSGTDFESRMWQAKCFLLEQERDAYREVAISNGKTGDYDPTDDVDTTAARIMKGRQS